MWVDCKSSTGDGKRWITASIPYLLWGFCLFNWQFWHAAYLTCKETSVNVRVELIDSMVEKTCSLILGLDTPMLSHFKIYISS